MRSFTVAGPRPFRLGLKVEGGVKTLDLLPGEVVFEAWLDGASIDRLIATGQLAEAAKVKDAAVPAEPEGVEVAFEPDAPEAEPEPVEPDGAALLDAAPADDAPGPNPAIADAPTE